MAQVLSRNEIKIGLQYITLPKGEWLIDLTAIHTEGLNDDDEDSLYCYKNPKDENMIVCERIRAGWGISAYGVGASIEEAIEDSTVAKSKAQPGVYFENSGTSYMIRKIFGFSVSELPEPENLPELSRFKKTKVGNVDEIYCTGKDDEVILWYDKTIMLVFKYSGKQTYPLGNLLWGQRWIPDSAQYLGSGNHVYAPATLCWRLNEIPLIEILEEKVIV